MAKKSKKSSPGSSLSTGYLLWQVSNSWQRGMRSALEPHGLTHVQFLLLSGLRELRDGGSDATQVKLARHTGTDVMMTSKVLRTLEQRKLVARKASSSDLRANTIVLSSSGDKLLQKAAASVTGADRAFFKHLSSKADKFEANLESLLSGNHY